MKKRLCLLMSAVFLCGCSSQQLVETVNDEWMVSTMSPQKEISVKLPTEAAQSVLAAEDGTELYFCDGYVLTLQTIPAGDMDRSTRTLCGYGKDRLTLLQTEAGNLRRYDWTWTSAGEGTVQVGRAAVLDDGDYHYCMTVMADEAVCGSLDDQWDQLFDTLKLQY